jgi:two-component system, chemotaxis family, chemotaxis protein CheV
MGKQEILLETGTNEFEMLEFYINEITPDNEEPEKNCFGVNVAKVVEVIESPNLENKDYAVNPCSLGTIPLRGHVLPVIDLSIWLGIEREKHEYENIIVTQFSNSIQGFLVSGVVEIHRLTWKDLIPPGKFIRHLNTKSIVGMVNINDRFVQLIDLEHIVSDLNMEIADELLSETTDTSKIYKALIADDSPSIRNLLESYFASSNFDAKIVDNGEEAYQYLMNLKEQAKSENRKIKEYLDIVISDIEMPMLDGLSLTKRIKEDHDLKKLPVILYSSIITDALRHKGESVGADFQVAKPDLNKMAGIASGLIEEYSRKAV